MIGSAPNGECPVVWLIFHPSLIQRIPIPLASLFFVSYEATKRLLGASVDPKHSHFVHMAAASFGEIVSWIHGYHTGRLKQGEG